MAPSEIPGHDRTTTSRRSPTFSHLSAGSVPSSTVVCIILLFRNQSTAPLPQSQSRRRQVDDRTSARAAPRCETLSGSPRPGEAKMPTASQTSENRKERKRERQKNAALLYIYRDGETAAPCKQRGDPGNTCARKNRMEELGGGENGLALSLRPDPALPQSPRPPSSTLPQQRKAEKKKKKSPPSRPCPLQLAQTVSRRPVAGGGGASSSTFATCCPSEAD